MKLDPSTIGDFDRIYNHHDGKSDEGRAEEIEEQLYEDARVCDTSPTAYHRGLTFKRVRNGYRFFLCKRSGDQRHLRHLSPKRELAEFD
nr:hypothetical protein [uncultured Gellertiella sp.]